MSRWKLFATQLVAAVSLTASGSGSALAQEKALMVRLSKLVIDASQLEAYRTFLTEEVNDSMRLEPGVRTLYAVSEKERPTHFTILEIYADRAAYEAHIFPASNRSSAAHLQVRQQFVERDWIVPHPDTGCVVDGIGNCSRNPAYPKFSNAHRLHGR